MVVEISAKTDECVKPDQSNALGGLDLRLNLRRYGH